MYSKLIRIDVKGAVYVFKYAPSMFWKYRKRATPGGIFLLITHAQMIAFYAQHAVSCAQMLPLQYLKITHDKCAISF